MKKFLLVVLVLVVNFAAVQAHEDHKKPRQISVTGTAKLETAPDKAVIRFAIISKDKKAEKAREANELTSKEVLNSVRELGVEEKYMQLESLYLNEEQKYNPKTQSYDSEGYKATRSFIVELHDLDKLAGIIAAVVSHGSNELSGVEYGLIDPLNFRMQALKQATANAAQKADLMLGSLNEKRGEALNIEEISDNYIPYPHAGFKQARVMAMDASAAPVAEEESFAKGHIEVEASVRVAFAIANGASLE